MHPHSPLPLVLTLLLTAVGSSLDRRSLSHITLITNFPAASPHFCCVRWCRLADATPHRCAAAAIPCDLPAVLRCRQRDAPPGQETYLAKGPHPPPVDSARGLHVQLEGIPGTTHKNITKLQPSLWIARIVPPLSPRRAALIGTCGCMRCGKQKTLSAAWHWRAVDARCRFPLSLTAVARAVVPMNPAHLKHVLSLARKEEEKHDRAAVEEDRSTDLNIKH